ncbi:hypothetical protein [Sphingomonas sp. ABOLH]|uniref:PGN_0703 family putative restriction endonuclease n=1 Tax=Sphingomonas sp. ABOLH TaxID=1985881 RepID=UPI000F7DE486|nr:hypothetical protein [Sphingomonas sp. ABOLH]RSV29447.1 hypothetical protein CA237_09250 [Sphingomonas sp. ABOLH]
MTIRLSTFLPGVPEDLVRAALAKAGGNEINSGKLDSPESSAALAVNAFGWFLERPADLPPFPPLANLDWPAVRVDVERQMRFPWRGGRHPWLDAAIETATHLIGVESKRFEPFRDAKSINLSDAYDRDVWGERMAPFTAMRDRLRTGDARYVHLDAAQLVKHAFGLVTEGRRLGKMPVLLYLYVEPTHRGTAAVPATAIERHRAEIADFATAVAGAEVRFAACSWREWLAGWTGDTLNHADALIERFQP